MSLRGSSTNLMMSGTPNELEDPLAALQQQEDNLSEDDNAQADEVVETGGGEDPLLLAIDDLEGRVVAALDDVKLHPGVRTTSAAAIGAAPTNVHQELATLLRPVLEVAAHTGPSVARTYYRGVGVEGVDAAVEDVYERIVSDLVLPVLLEMAQSDTIPAKRGASLEFFRHFWQECHKAGSWLDTTTSGAAAGPYGSGQTSSASHVAALPRPVQRRRKEKRLAREGEILRYWVQASIATTLPGVFTAEEADSATASRGIIAASASLRPSLKHIVQRIKDADDRGANRLYSPVMKMVEGVLKKLFLSYQGEAMLSACIKFLEIVIMCCSRKPQDASTRRRGHTTMGDFSLDDLPEGHPIITREALESIAEYAFTALRGLTLMGGQVKIDVNILSDMMLTTGDGSPSAQVVSMLKPAALAYLEIESTLPKLDAEDALELELDRSSLDFDFLLSQKSYALTINAMSALAINRPIFFNESAVCLARRAVQPPVEGGSLNASAVKAITSQLKSSCLTLLRNALSVTANAYEILQKALKKFDMEMQAEKALSMARQANSLKTAGRAARNRANIYYEWETSDTRSSKRQRETDDALAMMRAAKAARGLGHGIQLPTSMSDAVELVLANLEHLPTKRPTGPTKSRKVPISLDFVVDAIMTNGASLSQEEGRWYDRDGGTAWTFDKESENRYILGDKLLETMDLGKSGEDAAANKRRKLFQSQCHTAASDAIWRIVSNASYSRSKSLANFGNQIAARLAFTLKGVQPSSKQESSFSIVRDTVSSVQGRFESEDKESLERFVDSYPIAASGLALDATVNGDQNGLTETEASLSERILNEVLPQTYSSSDRDNKEEEETWEYDRGLDLFVAAAVHAGERANEKPSDVERKKAATRSAANLQRDIAKLPRLTRTSLLLISAMCDIEEITKKAAEATRKTSQESIVASAAAHAAKVAAEKRATAALLILRDTAFQRDVPMTRKGAVECAVGIAAGRLPSSPSIQDKALKLVMNVLYAKNELLSKHVVEAATTELEAASKYAVDKYDSIQKANKEAESKGEDGRKNPLVPYSEEERQAMDRMRKPAVLYMALCVRQPAIIESLFKVSCIEKGDVLSKAVRANMSKLARAAATKHGAATIAFDVASMAGDRETPMLLSFLENLVATPDPELIEACFKIQDVKLDASGNKDPRFIIPVVSAMKRKELAERLPDFVSADDKVFLAALVRMSDRVGRQALLYRDEPDEENPTLLGMTLCEQLVFLHKLDFVAAGIAQKRYLAAIKLCLEDVEVYNDRVLMSALDHMSGTFLTGTEKLPLAFMRTCILVCTKHESLHNWIAHVLLPRLVDGKIYEDARQWEGWMRCAHMLEKSGESGVNANEAIQKLPPEQLMQYNSKWAGK